VNIDILENEKDSDKEKSRMLLVEGAQLCYTFSQKKKTLVYLALSCIVDTDVAEKISYVDLTRSNSFPNCNKYQNKHASF
jgi:hypothetical protein